jgi:cell division protein FtsI/penicillin-binding protein 2
MVAIRHFVLPLFLGLLAWPPSGARTEVNGAARPVPTLFAQSAAATLAREFSSPDISFLLVDVHSGAVLAARWDNPEKPIPLGSLVKPFTALAYGEHHDFQYPVHVCRGAGTGCWLPRGHGQVDLTSAIAHSCNSYFRALTANMTAAEVSPIATYFGLQAPPADVTGPALAGLGNRWLISPISIAGAYLELLRHRDQPGASQIFAGMAQSARQGTGSAVDRALPYPDALVKTGTAVCTHRAHAPGDGFTVALMPADQPQILLLVRVHGVPGAEAARTAGRMLREIRE